MFSNIRELYRIKAEIRAEIEAQQEKLQNYRVMCSHFHSRLKNELEWCIELCEQGAVVKDVKIESLKELLREINQEEGNLGL